MANESFLCGVVEGFYGRPWTHEQRLRLFRWMGDWRMNTYLYAPKDDLKHRALWQELYSDVEAASLRALIRESRACGVRFFYALAPGLDDTYSNDIGLTALERKVSQLTALGCDGFALLFDDIVEATAAGPVEVNGRVASEQARVANHFCNSVRSRVSRGEVLFCPTQYCGRMAGDLRQSDYLKTLGAELDREIQILWTGPEIISETISAESVHELRGVLQRKPVIWDNLHANDYDGRRLYLGPYSGRPLELRSQVNGVLSNPNGEFEANFVPLRTLASWAQAQMSWDARAAYLSALEEWRPMWTIYLPSSEQTHRAPEASDELMDPSGLKFPPPERKVGFGVGDLELLGDCFYLPFQHGPRAETLMTEFQHLLRMPPSAWGRAYREFMLMRERFDYLMTRLTHLENRDLLYALYRHVWDLKEELHLLAHYLNWLMSKPGLQDSFQSAEHRPKLYRGGFVADLQRLLPMNTTGEFSHRPSLLPPHDSNPYR